jgi:hypothetical protein
MMNRTKFASTLMLLACAWMISCKGPGPGNTYYISLDGDDSSPGTSPAKAWRTIGRVNQQDFAPGDRILFRGGDTFQGTIILSADDAGTAVSRLGLSSYGEGKAIISGRESEALKADSCIYLTVEHMEFTGLGRKSGNTTDGLLIRQCDDLVLDELEVSGFQHSGVHVHQCNDAVITHVVAHENGFAGIHVTGTTIWDSANYDNHNLYIGYCIAENNPGDPTVLNNHSGNGILASSVEGGVIEYCEAFNNGWDMPWTGNGPVGIWIWDCTEFTIQHCIAHHNRTNPEAADGGGFDFDGGVSNSVIQYCISFSNEGAGFGLYEFGAAKAWENNTVRYNLSVDDGIINGGSAGIWKDDNQGTMRNCQIYNNTFYNSQEDGSCIWMYDNYPGYHFYNNAFVYNGTLIAEGQTLKDEVFLGNLYWNLSGDESFFEYDSMEEWAETTGNERYRNRTVGLYQDPLFQNAGPIGVTDPKMVSRESVAGYIPQSGSPLVDGGLDLRALFQIDPGVQDLLGNSLTSGKNYDIGAIELDF